jgi:hypothetical protein
MYIIAEGGSQNAFAGVRRGFCGVIRNLYMNTCHLCVNSATKLLTPQQKQCGGSTRTLTASALQG